MMRFLGSALFAVILLILTAFIVMIGTFVESKTGSHLFAMQTIYSSWLFRTLLALFFINILVSALRRYPFKLKHVPFLITHLGLLTIITGLFIKNVFGLQGILIAPAGSWTDTLYIPEEREIVVETDRNERFTYPLSENLIAEHSELSIDSFFKGGFLDIVGLKPIPILPWKKGEELFPSGRVRMPEGELFHVVAIRTDDVDEAISELPSEKTLFFAETSDHTLHIVGKDGYHLERHEIGKRCAGGQLLAYNEGFSGYGLQVPFPCPFYESVEVPVALVRALTLLSMIIDDVQKNDPHAKNLVEAFKKRNFPFLQKFDLYEREDFLATLLEMILSLENDPLPLAPLPEEKLVNLYQQIYPPASKERPLLETRLKLNWKEKSSMGVKSEDLLPLVSLKLGAERVIAGLDLEGKGFTESALSGTAKVYVAPRSHKIPYAVRVQDAREFTYPGTTQAKEYECTFYLKDSNAQIERHHIGLNRVFETHDGYRFFLSSIYPNDGSAPQEVRLAVNYDPSRRILIYIGSTLVALGIILLYFFVMRKK